MNVLILTKTFPETAEEWGGIFVQEQAEAIATEHVVTVVKCRVDYKNFNPFLKFKIKSNTSTGYKYYNVIVSKSFPVYNQFNFIVSAYIALKKIIKECQPAIIHCHYSYPAGVVAWLVRHKTGIPYIITEHTRIVSTFRSVFHRFLSLIALRKACCVISVSNSLKTELLSEGIATVDVIPNVINTDRFSITEKRSVPFTIGFLGSLNTHNKGLDILLSACSELPFDFILKIGGAGTYLDYYKELARKNNLERKAVFMEGIASLQKSSFYSDINLFVLPSRYETFGIVLVEAMASGIPVVATRCGGPDDIVNDKTGILTEIEDSLMMRKAIIKIYSDFPKYNAEEIRDYVINKFGHEPFLKQINLIYQTCLSK